MADMDSEDAGCMYTVGVVIIGVAVGNLAGEAWGWLTIGCILVLTCWSMWISRMVRGRKQKGKKNDA